MISEREKGLRLLEKLAAFLLVLPKGNFYYGLWSEGTEGAVCAKPRCGTTACALGWAPSIPAIRRKGLKLDDTGTPRLGDFSGADAASEVFGISYQEAEYLFDPLTSYGTLPDSPGEGAGARTVARHILRFVRYARKHVA